MRDTLGNTYTFALDANSRLNTITYPNTNGTTSRIILQYQTQTLVFGTEPTDPTLGTQYKLTTIILPSTGLRFSFTYLASGEVSEITYPTCGKSRYYYTTFSNILDRPTGQAVSEHLVTSHEAVTEAGTSTWTWTYGFVYLQAAPTTVVVIYPGGAAVAHYNQKTSPGWADGLLTKATELGSPGRESRQDWTQDNESLATILNPRVTSAEKVLKAASGGATKVVRTEFTYASTTDYSGNVKEIREYSFAGSLRRRTQLIYLHEWNSSYIARNIIDRVAQSLVYDGSGTLVSKAVASYDEFSPLYSAAGAIRHDASFGPTFLTRGLPTIVRRWYDVTNNLSVATVTKYDECGNPREAIDARNYTTFTEYWLSSADNAYAFPLRVTNPKGHVTRATWSYSSGVVLTRTDANSKVTSMAYDNYDRIVLVTRPDGGTRSYTYMDTVLCQYNQTPYVEITQAVTSTTSRTERAKVDVMGRPMESSLLDPGGTIKQVKTWGASDQLSASTQPYREGQTSYATNYYLLGPELSRHGRHRRTAAGFPTCMTSTRRPSPTPTARSAAPRTRRTARSARCVEEDGYGQLTVETNYSYDTLGRLVTITQGVQTRTFTYDALGRLKTETHPESGTTTYTYDANSNLLTRTDARGNDHRIQLRRAQPGDAAKTYSDGTPSVDYFYDSQPAGSPITISNPVGRLTKVYDDDLRRDGRRTTTATATARPSSARRR